MLWLSPTLISRQAVLPSALEWGGRIHRTGDVRNRSPLLLIEKARLEKNQIKKTETTTTTTNVCVVVF